jgi:hypothetical protein
MPEKNGHFEKGVWIEEPPAGNAAPDQSSGQIDVRLASATKAVLSAMDELARATHDLVTTEEGKKHIEKTMKDTTANVQKSFDDIISRAKAEMDKAVSKAKK